MGLETCTTIGLMIQISSNISVFIANQPSPPITYPQGMCILYTLQTGSYLQFLGPSAMHREGYLVGCIDRQDKMKGHTIRSHRISRSN